MGDRKKDDQPEKEKFGDKVGKRMYRDHDSYDWSGKKTEDGWDVRKKGSDR